MMENMEHLLDRLILEIAELKSDIRFCRDAILKLEMHNGELKDLAHRVQELERARDKVTGWLIGSIVASGGASAILMKLFTG